MIIVLTKHFFISIYTTKNNQLFAQTTRQPQFEIFPEAEAVFFLKSSASQVGFW
jgi:hypothetical protein